MAENRGDFTPAFSDEMFDQIVVDVYEYIKSGTLSEKKVLGVATEMIAKRDDVGNLIYRDIRFQDEERPIKLNTMIGRIRLIVQDWKKYLAPMMEPLLLEAVYKHAAKAKDSTQSFKVASDMIMPKESADDGNKPALPPRVAAILQQNPVGTTIVIGEAAAVEGTGDNGHAGANRVHPVADGQQENPPVGVVPSADDKLIHGLFEWDDTAQGDTISITSIPSEDPVDNDGGDDLDSIERPGRVSSG